MITRLTPWFTERAVNEIDRRLQYMHNLRILEFGMGISTLYYLNHPRTKWMISVEHDAQWFSKIAGLAPEAKRNNFSPMHLPLPYAQTAFGLIMHETHFNMIIIDGRDRAACLEHAPRFLAETGFIVLDNSEREQYRPAVKKLIDQNFHETCYTQLEPDRWGFTYPSWQTSILQRNY